MDDGLAHGSVSRPGVVWAQHGADPLICRLAEREVGSFASRIRVLPRVTVAVCVETD